MKNLSLNYQQKKQMPNSKILLQFLFNRSVNAIKKGAQKLNETPHLYTLKAKKTSLLKIKSHRSINKVFAIKKPKNIPIAVFTIGFHRSNNTLNSI